MPDARRHKEWFFFYLFVSTVFFTPLKNLLSVVAQIQELVLERHWKVTPRDAAKST